jgi:uncharacterized protein YaiI (UPF0178 family)
VNATVEVSSSLRSKPITIYIDADTCPVKQEVCRIAVAIAPNGRAFTADLIGMTLATRNLMDSLQSAGEMDAFANNSVGRQYRP